MVSRRSSLAVRAARRRLASAALHLLGLVLLALAFVVGDGRLLVREDPLAPADAIVVLGGEDNGYRRTRRAIELLEDGEGRGERRDQGTRGGGEGETRGPGDKGRGGWRCMRWRSRPRCGYLS
jgi:hypothetical protein